MALPTRSNTVRAMMSDAAPVANGTTTRTGRLG